MTQLLRWGCKAHPGCWCNCWGGGGKLTLALWLLGWNGCGGREQEDGGSRSCSWFTEGIHDGSREPWALAVEEKLWTQPYGTAPERELEWLRAPAIHEVCGCRLKQSRTEEEPGLRWKGASRTTVLDSYVAKSIFNCKSLFICGDSVGVLADSHRNKNTSVFLQCSPILLLRILSDSVNIN